MPSTRLNTMFGRKEDGGEGRETDKERKKIEMKESYLFYQSLESRTKNERKERGKGQNFK